MEPHLPENEQSGGQWRDHRQVIGGIFWKLRTGAPWRDLPDEHEPRRTAHSRYRRWRRDGTWAHILRALLENR